MLYVFKNTMFVLFVSMFCFCCTMKVFSDEKLAIDSHFSFLFYSVTKKDTIQFTGSNGNRKIFVITNIDSITSNSKGWFINERPYKLLRSKYKEIGIDTFQLQRENEIFVNKNPEENQNSIAIQFNNFYYHDTLLPPLHHDTISLNGKVFTNYYVFKTTLGLKNPNDIQLLYIDIPNGFLGFKTFSGATWLAKN